MSKFKNDLKTRLGKLDESELKRVYWDIYYQMMDIEDQERFNRLQVEDEVWDNLQHEFEAAVDELERRDLDPSDSNPFTNGGKTPE